jgi:hypothetical protein
MRTRLIVVLYVHYGSCDGYYSQNKQLFSCIQHYLIDFLNLDGVLLLPSNTANTNVDWIHVDGNRWRSLVTAL